jgi:hypothetical protein
MIHSDLRRECPTFFSEADALEQRAQMLIKEAKKEEPLSPEREQLLNASLQVMISFF